MRLGSVMAGLFGAVFLFAGLSQANSDWSNVPKKKQSSLGLYMTPEQAYNTMKKEGKNTLCLE